MIMHRSHDYCFILQSRGELFSETNSTTIEQSNMQSSTHFRHHLKQKNHISLSLLHRMMFTPFMGSCFQKPYMALAPYLALCHFIKKTAKKCAKHNIVIPNWNGYNAVRWWRFFKRYLHISSHVTLSKGNNISIFGIWNTQPPCDPELHHIFWCFLCPSS